MKNKLSKLIKLTDIYKEDPKKAATHKKRLAKYSLDKVNTYRKKEEIAKTSSQALRQIYQQNDRIDQAQQALLEICDQLLEHCRVANIVNNHLTLYTRSAGVLARFKLVREQMLEKLSFHPFFHSLENVELKLFFSEEIAPKCEIQYKNQRLSLEADVNIRSLLSGCEDNEKLTKALTNFINKHHYKK